MIGSNDYLQLYYYLFTFIIRDITMKGVVYC